MQIKLLIASLSFTLLFPVHALSGELNWTTRSSPQRSEVNSTQKQVLNSSLLWNRSTSPETRASSSSWQIVTPLAQLTGNGLAMQPYGSTSAADPSTPDAASPEPDKSVQQNPWIIGIGGGIEFEPDPIIPVAYARLGRFVSPNASLSLRPRFDFGNTDLQGKTNSEVSFKMPLTLDLHVTPWLSPYVGGGISTNTDSTGRTNGMVSFGADIYIARNLALDLGLNYIAQPNANDSNGGDFEFATVLYFRF